MKKTKYTEQQIAFALKQAETGISVQEVCRKMGISEATFYNWKKKYGGLGITELRRLRQLEDENFRLKQIVADLTLDKQMLQDVLKKMSEGEAVKAVGSEVDRSIQGICKEGLFCGITCPFDVVLQINQALRQGG